MSCVLAEQPTADRGSQLKELGSSLWLHSVDSVSPASKQLDITSCWGWGNGIIVFSTALMIVPSVWHYYDDAIFIVAARHVIPAKDVCFP